MCNLYSYMVSCFRDVTIEYSEQVMNLGEFLFTLLSEALGLNPNHLNDMDCSKGLIMLCHYYPLCPEPDLTLGTSQHADNTFLTVLLPDQIEGLQVLREGYWFNVPHVPGALIINIGDLLQASLHNQYIFFALFCRSINLPLGSNIFLFVCINAAYNKRQVRQFGAQSIGEQSNKSSSLCSRFLHHRHETKPYNVRTH